jgi:TolB-like protein
MKTSGTRFILSFIFIFIITAADYSFGADDIRITVSDFSVKSAKAEYMFLGKGFTEFIGVDLSKGKGVTLVEREKRRDLIREMELSMTGLVDENAQVQVGKMLAANYIVVGNIFDLAGQITVTYKLIETETGKIILQNKISGNISEYDYISASIAKNILNLFELKTPKSLNNKIENKKEKQEETVIVFSKAVDAYDRNDRKTAKSELDKAKELDPDNEAVRIYLDKLIVNTAKFRTLSERYFPNTNPSYLGIINYDALSVTVSLGPLSSFPDPEKAWQKTDDGKTEYYEEDGFFYLSYLFPVGKNLGFGAELFGGVSSNRIRVSPDQVPPPGEPKENANRNVYKGGIFSAGISLNDYISIGGSFSLYQHYNEYLEEEIETEIVKAGTAGFLIKNADSTIIFDTVFGYTGEQDNLIDSSTHSGYPMYEYPLGDKISAPKYNENTITIGLLNKDLFVVGKEINYFYPGDNNYVCRFIPALEYWLVPSFSLRGGADLSYQKIFGQTDTGIGGTGGFTIRSLSTGVELDFNTTYRKQPSLFIEGESYEQFVGMLTITWRNLFIER